MRHLLLPLTPRYILLTIAVTCTLVLAALAWRYPQAALHLALPLGIFGFFALLGLRDLVQTKHAILRNYPIAAHNRFILEHTALSSDSTFSRTRRMACPSRATNAPLCKRAKQALDKRPFGTHYDVYRDQYEWLHHSIAPKTPSGELFRIAIGAPHCAKVYSASVFNISALSFGSLSANAISRSTGAPDWAVSPTTPAKAG
jgi:glutamate synthase domain-containing protein 2